jgi:hypothetical protein
MNRCTTVHQFPFGLRRFVGRTPWSAADAHVGLLGCCEVRVQADRPTKP